MALQASVRDWQLQQDLKRWNTKSISTKAVLQQAATRYPGTVFRDQDGQVALTLDGDNPGDVVRATIKTYIPIDGYVVSIVRLYRSDASTSLACSCKTWTVDSLEEAQQWLENHGLNLDNYNTVQIDHALQDRGDQ